MLAALILIAAVSAPPAHLTLAPWTGKSLPTVTQSAAKYRLQVDGKAHARLRLEASGVAEGWLAAFCTPTLCAPGRVDVILPESGRAVYQFELIREDTTGPARSGARISGDDGSVVTVSPPASLP